MAKEKKKLLENFLSLQVLQIFTYALPLITLPYLSRVLGADRFGLVFFAQAMMFYFMILTDYGFELSATREVAVNRHNQNNLSNIFNSVTIIKSIFLIISLIILIIAITFISKLNQEWLIFLLSFLMVIGNAIFPVWFFQGMEHMKYITFLNIFSKTLFLVLIFIFVKNSSNYILVPLLNGLGFIISGTIGFIFAIRKFKLKLYIPSWKNITKQFKYSTEFFLSKASVAAFTTTNTFFLGLISSNIAVAYYIAAEKIYTAVKQLVQPINNALYPFIAKNKDLKTYKKIYFLTVSLGFLISIFVFITAKYIILIFYGKELLLAYKILKIFCITLFITFPSIMLGYPLLGGMGYVKEANRSVIYGSFIHIVGLLLLYLLKIMNPYTIAFMVLITEGLIYMARLYYVNKYKLLKENTNV